jgi:SAM-dependent methyltransferase
MQRATMNNMPHSATTHSNPVVKRAREKTVCPLCSGERSAQLNIRVNVRTYDLFLEEKLQNKIGQYFLCKNCTAMFRWPKVNVGALSSLFGGGIYHNEKHPDNIARGGVAKFHYSREATLERAKSLGSIHYHFIENAVVSGKKKPFGPGCRFLDIGCGQGYALVAFAERGWQVEGIEPDPRFSDFIRENWGFEVGRGLAEEIPFDLGEKYDLIYSSRSWHMLADPIGVIQKIERALVPGGLVFISLHTIEKNGSLSGLDALRGLVAGNTNFMWDHHGLSYLLEKAGFKVVKVKNYGTGNTDFLAEKYSTERRPSQLEVDKKFSSKWKWIFSYLRVKFFLFYNLFWRSVTAVKWLLGSSLLNRKSLGITK